MTYGFIWLGLTAKQARVVESHRRRTIDEEITLCLVAMWRRHLVLRAQSDEWRDAGGVCCPDCMFGEARREIHEQQRRTGAWLTHMLRRRAQKRPDRFLSDARLALDIERQSWP